MNDSHADLILRRILRIAAVVSIVAVAVLSIVDPGPVGPNHGYNLLALWFVTFAAVIACGLQFDNLFRILTNIDLAVPVAIYAGIRMFVSRMAESALAPGDSLRSIDQATLIWAPLALDLLLTVIFVGWTTRMMLDFALDGAFSLTGSLRRANEWFPRTLAGLALCWLVFGAILFVAIIIGDRGGVLVYPMIILIAVATPIANLATAGLVPFLLLNDGPPVKSVIDGLKFGLRNSRLTWLPILLYMIAAGFFFYASVTYQAVSKGSDDARFGRTWSSNYSTKSTSNFSVNFGLVALFPIKSETHTSMMKLVESSPSPTVAFRISILLIIVGLCTNLTIIRNLFGDPFEGAVPRPFNASDRRVFVQAGIVVLLLALPYEPIATSISNGASDGFPDMNSPRVYLGAERFEVKTLISADDAGKVFGSRDGVNVLTNWRSFSYDSSCDALIVADGEHAAWLDSEGKLVKLVRFDFGPVSNQTKKSHLRDVNPVDLDGDGVPEFVGELDEPRAAVVLDSVGRYKWHVATPEMDLNNVVGVSAVNGKESKVFAVGTQGTVVFDRNGKKISKLDLKTDLSSDVRVVGANGVGDPYIVVKQGLGVVFADVSTGKMRRVDFPVHVEGIFDGDVPQTIYFGDNRIGLFDLNGNLRWKGEAPKSSASRRPLFSSNSENDQSLIPTVASAALVRFDDSTEPFFAVTVNIVMTPLLYIKQTQMLYIYDGGGRLVYQESFNGTWTGRVLAVPSADGTESLLWIGDKTVKSYSIKAS